ncbi:hypothetical protein A7U60_g1127 [Sanghuangporus baumii]|uniref:Uncharacterized protein n=1 Tax=Sanghuangporus baumii TaxID=108892 RepID=A0A9Q5I4J2_SANBA|nr:hypothetical protein A7U60_g1127 [Sanghuangporus baumii]
MPELTARRRLRLRQQWWWTSVGIQLVLTNLADAAPATLRPRQSDHQQASSNRNDDTDEDDGSDISPKVWAPAVAVVLIILGGFFFVYTRTSILTRLRQAATRAARSASRPGTPGSFTGTSTREVTAAQLTGAGENARSNNNNSNAGRNNGGRMNPRPGRRNGRTPSQMSTHSLPVYMKEPGDQELVIFRGPDEMDVAVDVSIAEARESESEDREDREDDEGQDSGSLSRQESRASVLVLDSAPSAPNRESILGPEPRPDQSAMSLGISEAGAGERDLDTDTSTTQLLPRASSPSRQREQNDSRRDSGNSANSASILMCRTSDVPSEAPPDYEFAANMVNTSGNEDLQTGRDSTSTGACGIVPPGLTGTDSSSGADNAAEPRGSSSRESYPPSSSSPVPFSISSASSSPSLTPQSSRLAGGPGAARQSRFVSHVSRMSQFFHLRNASNANVNAGADSALPENDAAAGRVSDVTSGLVPAARADSRTSNVVSLNEPSASSPSPVPSASQLQQLPRQVLGQSHRHSNSSTSTLAFHLPLRTLSRPRSSNTLSSAFAASASRSNVNLHNTANASNPNQANLTSPSTLSLGQSILAGQTSISAPLPHTLMRTEIRYPAGGPTPDQVKLLSSREGLGKFGVPYGESAVEFARSSRLGLSLDMSNEEDQPPPMFESPSDERAEGATSSASRGHRASGSGSSGSAHEADRRRRSEDSDVHEGEGDDPDALPPPASSSNTDTNTNRGNSGTSSPALNRSSENLHAMETRVLLPLFL